jgi:hypothetical protein
MVLILNRGGEEEEGGGGGERECGRRRRGEGEGREKVEMLQANKNSILRIWGRQNITKNEPITITTTNLNKQPRIRSKTTTAALGNGTGTLKTIPGWSSNGPTMMGELT